MSWLQALENNQEASFQLVSKIPERYENFKLIQKSFLHCYFDSSKTEVAFENIIKQKDYSFSRYNFFLASYLVSKNENTARWKCNEEICLQLRNHDASNKSFEIHMINSVPVFGFQCDLQGIEIINSTGGLLQENEYQTSNSASRLLSFSMQAKPIPVGMGILTEVHYDNPEDVVCMTKIIFAGIGGSKLSNNIPECMELN